MSATLEFQDLTVGYGARIALESISLTVPGGAQVAVVGPNGAGKSTLFKAIVGFLGPRAGRILVDGRPVGEYRGRIAYVPQRQEIDWKFPVTAYDVVAMGRYGRGRWLGALGSADRRIVRDCLEKMGVAALARYPIGELSGGQQQRVFLARALACEPAILVLDEPFTGVDAATRQTILDLLAGLRSQAVTVLVSTHDLDLAASRFDQVVLLNKHLVCAGAPQVVFTREHLRGAFGGQMVVVEGMAVVVDQCCGCGGNEDEGLDVPSDPSAGLARQSGRGDL